MPTTIAFVAQSGQHEELADFVYQYRAVFSRFRLVATATTAQHIRNVGLEIDALLSGAAGGYVQIAAQVIAEEVAGLICLRNSNAPQSPDMETLLRTCETRDIPFSTNLATARLLVRALIKSRTAYLIFNPVSGQGNPKADLALIRKLLQAQLNLEIIHTEPDVSPAQLVREILQSVKADDPEEAAVSMVIASGGDGTVSEVAGALIGTDIPLGVIPRGTANAFSVGLGIPTNINGACEAILMGNTKKIDAAFCNQTPMILLAGIGFEAETIERASRELKDRFGPLAYLWAGMQQFREQEAFDAELEIDGKTTEIQAAAITIANVAPPTSVLAQGFGEVVPNDGRLEVTVTASTSRLQGLGAMASLFASALVKQQFEREDILCLRATQIKVTTNPPQKVVLDGEMVGTTPVEFTCSPASITVFVPPL